MVITFSLIKILIFSGKEYADALKINVKTTKLILLDSLLQETKWIENDCFNRNISSSLKIV